MDHQELPSCFWVDFHQPLPPLFCEKHFQCSIISDAAAADVPIKFSPLCHELFLTSPPAESICLRLHKSASLHRGGGGRAPRYRVALLSFLFLFCKTSFSLPRRLYTMVHGNNREFGRKARFMNAVQVHSAVRSLPDK